MIRLPSPVIALTLPLAFLTAQTWVVGDPCSEEEIARLKAEYREKAQQLVDLENATPMVNQLSELRGYLDVLNEAAGETKSDINEFSEDFKPVLDQMKTEVKTYNTELQRWSPSVHHSDAFEGKTTTTTREVSVTEGLNVTAERLGELEEATGKASEALAALEKGMEAQTPAAQLAAFRDYFDTMTGLFTSDEMKAAFPVLHVFAPWLDYFSKSLEFATAMTESIQRSAAERDAMLRELGYTDMSYSPKYKTPYELLAEQKEKLQAELDEIAAKLEDCGQEVPEVGTGDVSTEPTVDRYARKEAEFRKIMEFCHQRTGIDPATAKANEAALHEARARTSALAQRLARLRWRLNIPEGQPTDNAEVRELLNEVTTAYADYRDKRRPVIELRTCVYQYYWGFFEKAPGGSKPVHALKDLPTTDQYKPYTNLKFWDLKQFAEGTINLYVPEQPEDGAGGPGTAAPTGSGGADPGAGGQGDEPESPASEDEDAEGVPAPDAAGDVSVPGAAAGGAAAGEGAAPATGGAEEGTGALTTGSDFPLTGEVDPIDFEIEPAGDDEADDAVPPGALPQDDPVPTQGSDSPVTGDAPGAPAPEGVSFIDPAASAPLLNSPLTAGSVDPTTQPMMVDLFDLELGAVEAYVPADDEDRAAVPGHGGVMYLAADGSGGLALLAPAPGPTDARESAVGPDEPRVTAFLTSLGVSTGEAFDLVALNEGDLPVRISGDGIVVEPVQLEDEAKRQLQSKLTELAGQNAIAAKLDAYCLEFLARPPAAGQLFRIASSELQEQFAPMRGILKAGREAYESGLLNPDSDPVAYMHSIKQWALWSHEKGFDLESFTDAFLEHTKKNFEAANRDWNGQVEEAVRGVLPNRWNDIQQVLRAAGETPGASD